MIKLLRPIAVIVVALAAWPAAAQSLQPNSTWTNQRGSTLTILALKPDGSFTGSYVDHEPGGACRDSPYPASGWIDGQKITFAVRWASAAANCQAITSWTGYLGSKGMLTEWVLVYIKRGQPAFLNGKDIFH